MFDHPSTTEVGVPRSKIGPEIHTTNSEMQRNILKRLKSFSDIDPKWKQMVIFNTGIINAISTY